jgi:hypothetical protein
VTVAVKASPVGKPAKPKFRVAKILWLGAIASAAIATSVLSLKFFRMAFVWIDLVWAGAFVAGVFCVTRSWVRVALWNLAVVAVIFAAFEIYLSLHEHTSPTYQEKYFTSDAALGWAPLPGVRERATKFNPLGAQLYDVTYTVGQNRFRIAPPASQTSAECILFFGDSFTFGEGLQDDETLPYQVGLQSDGRYRTFNFGFHGYGPHQMLAAIETGLVRRTVDCTPKYAFYWAIPDHVARAAGKVDFVNGSPRYQLDELGHVQLAGKFENPLPTTSVAAAALRRQFSKSAIYRLLAAAQPKVSHDDIRLALAIIGRSRQLLMEQYPGLQFHVLLWEVWEPDHNIYQELRDGLRNMGISTHSVWNVLPEFHFRFSKYSLGATDWHPNALADRLLANYLLTKVVANSGSMTHTATGPLVVSTANPRYFTNDGGHAVLLAGSHTWADLQDQGVPRPAVFDYNRYMQFMVAHRFNFMHLWTWWFPNGGTAEEGPIQFTSAPFPWRRVGPGKANDGGLKFDFSQLNQEYFDRVRSRIIQAGQNGIYVSIYLFNGYEFQFDVNPNDGNPFEGTNNVNGVDCPRTCPTDDTLIPNVVWTYEKSYIHKVVDTVNDLDNVLYMTSNESGSPYSDNWEENVIAEVKKYEATKSKRHPVGISFQFKGGSDSELYKSKAEWVSPNFGTPDGRLHVPPDATGECPVMTGNGSAIDPSSPNCKVIVADTDHICGICGTQAWAWKTFTRGDSLLFMDQYLVAAPKARFPIYDNDPKGACSNGQCATVDPKWDPIRRAMTDILSYADRIDLIHITPQDSLSTSGFCLANQGSQYLVYSETNSFVLTTVPGRYTYEWFNPSTHALADAGSITVGVTRAFAAPFSGDSVLWLHK